MELIAIGNGTASRETDKLAGELVTKNSDLNCTEDRGVRAGASVYSAWNTHPASFLISTYRCEAPLRSRDACKIRWRN